MRNGLVNKLIPLAIPLAILLEIAGVSYIPKDYGVKYMSRDRSATYMAIDKNKDGSPEIIVNGYLGGLGFAPVGILMREPTQKEIEEYKRLPK